MMESLVKAGHCVFCKTYIRPELDLGPNSRTGVRYCPNCGQQVWTKCGCGANLRYDDRFCETCGQKNPIFLKDDPDYLGDLIE